MTKIKYLTMVFIIIALLLIIPSISNAAELTYTDTAQGIEWGYELDSSNNVINLRCKTTGKTGSVTIPSTIDGKSVVSLNRDAFKDYTGITEVVIPDTITSIPNNAFSNCTGLTKVNIPNNVTTIGDGAFAQCSGLTSITMPSSVISIKSYAFDGCAGLKSITFSDNIHLIDFGAFRGCTGLKTITLPNKLTQIGGSAFSGCSGLTSISIPNTVTTIGGSAFKDCSGLKEVTLSNNLTKLDKAVFAGCGGLTAVKIPESVTTILGEGYSWMNEGAFCNCGGLKKILIPDNVASIGDDVFEGCSNLTIYGHDGQTSKTYAEENKIKFDYIENWDKPSTGTDITKPTVSSINVTYNSTSNYYNSTTKMFVIPAGVKLVIEANFSEAIKGTKVPTLTIKFGEGQNIEVTEGTISGSKIIYIYTVKSTDKGTMSAVSLTGGDITDTAGNAATLTCPKLEAGILGNEIVYANGTVTNPTPGSNAGTNTGSGNGSNNGGTNAGSGNGGNAGGSSKPGTSSSGSKKDPTTASGKMPQTGLSIVSIVAMVVVVTGGTIAYIQYRKLREV